MFPRKTSREHIRNLDLMIRSELTLLEKSGATRPSDRLEQLFKKQSHFVLDMIQEQLIAGRVSLNSRSRSPISPSVNECKQYGPYFIYYSIEQITATLNALVDDLYQEVCHLVKIKTKKIPDSLEMKVRQLEVLMLAKMTIWLIIWNSAEGHGTWCDVATPKSSGVDLSLSLSNSSVPPAPPVCPPSNSLDSWSEEGNGGCIFKEECPSIALASSAPIPIPRPNKKKNDQSYLGTYGMYSTDKDTSDKDTSSIASSCSLLFKMSEASSSSSSSLSSLSSCSP